MGVRRQKQRTQRARPNQRRERWRTGKQQEPWARCEYTCTSRLQLRCQQALVGTLSKNPHHLPAHALHLGALDFVAGRAGESIEENNPGRAQPEGNQGDGKSIDLAHTARFEVVLTVRAAAEAQSPIADAAPGLLTFALLAGQLTALPITELLLAPCGRRRTALRERWGQKQAKTEANSNQQPGHHVVTPTSDALKSGNSKRRRQ